VTVIDVPSTFVTAIPPAAIAADAPTGEAVQTKDVEDVKFGTMPVTVATDGEAEPSATVP
jgi:hypothetical protein